MFLSQVISFKIPHTHSVNARKKSSNNNNNNAKNTTKQTHTIWIVIFAFYADSHEQEITIKVCMCSLSCSFFWFLCVFFWIEHFSMVTTMDNEKEEGNNWRSLTRAKQRPIGYMCLERIQRRAATAITASEKNKHAQPNWIIVRLCASDSHFIVKYL